MLYKAVAIILSTVLLAVFQMSAANAGCGSRGGFHAYQARFQNTYASKKQRIRTVAAAKKKAAPVQQARVKKADQTKVAAAEPATKTVAKEEVEKTDKTTDTTKDAAATGESENELTVASTEPTCSKFIPQIGTTVAVECSKE